MRILDINNVELKSPNIKKGRLKKDKLFVRHHEAVEAVEEVGHYEVVAEYPKTGGRDLAWVVDVPAVEAREAYDEYEDVYRYITYTEEELDTMQKAPLSVDEKLMLLAESIQEEPYPKLPPKAGYKYQRIYSTSSSMIVWTSVPDPDSPVTFFKGMSVTEGLYYTDGNDEYLCHRSGNVKSLQNAEYFTKL